MVEREKKKKINSEYVPVSASNLLGLQILCFGFSRLSIEVTIETGTISPDTRYHCTRMHGSRLGNRKVNPD